ncbi:MAG: hypothetical protein JOY93_11255, partial [Acidobacteriales bacterium]|nr:hypothetical protein [Terriglobales bacterium]
MNLRFIICGPQPGGGILSSKLWQAIFLAAVLTPRGWAQAPASTHGVTLDSSETLFAVFTALNACGYDAELPASDPLRMQIRSEVAKNVQASEPARSAEQTLCQSYQQHQQTDPSRNLAQYVSLSLYLDPPPALTVKVKTADLPPDAAALVDMLPGIQAFYNAAGLHAIFERHRAAYAELIDRYHEPLAKMLFDTEIYLKFESSGYLGRGFTVYLEPMGAPGQTNARNYGADYFVVVSPGSKTPLKMDQIRHTYLHYLLDPLALKYPTSIKRLEPLLDTVKTAPMDESFKSDAGLLATECLIRTVEARTTKTTEAQKEQAVEASVEQGFILTRYFYEALQRFEKEAPGLRSVYGDMVANIDVRKEEKRVAQIQFAASADPELLHLPRPVEAKLLIMAEQRLSAGDAASAQKFAQQALDEKSEDAGRALFILAQVAVVQKNMDNARDYFQRALEAGGEPKVLAWSHIYLGRIFDLQEDRASALDHYR